MTGFHYWAILLSAILMLWGGVNGVIGNIRNKGAWWKWVLDVLSIAVAIWLLIALFS